LDEKQNKGRELRLVAFEVTRSCNLSCVHCRASSEYGPYPDELSTQEAITLLQDIRKVGQPIVILTGGEPLLRQDIFQIAQYGTQLGLKMVMATNGTLLNEEMARGIIDSGIKRVSISLDGADQDSHDGFRRVQGAFEASLRGIQVLRQAGIEFQINTTIVKSNRDQLHRINQLAVSLGAKAHHIFLLVPVGRGGDVGDMSLEAQEYENILEWFLERKGKVPLELKATCAPQYYRILRQRAKEGGHEVTFKTHGMDAVTRGCLGGLSFCFVGHRGQVQPCGYLEVECGNIRERPFTEIWKESPIFLRLRDFSNYKGKCGKCEYLKVCGGCRARAYELHGDFMMEEPLCSYIPRSMRGK